MVKMQKKNAAVNGGDDNEDALADADETDGRKEPTHSKYQVSTCLHISV